MSETEVKKAWLRLPGEKPQAYAAFMVYRDMGKGRNGRKVAQTIGKNQTTVFQWSKKHDWKNRAVAWDYRISDAKGEAAVRKAVSVIETETGDRIGRVLKERDEWLAEMKTSARLIKKQGITLASFPVVDKVISNTDGPSIFKAANASTIRTGARLVVVANSLMKSVLREELSAAAYSPNLNAELPHLDTARAVEVHRLDIFAESQMAAVTRGDLEAGALLLRVMERKARLLGLDAPPSSPQAQTERSPAPVFIEVRTGGNGAARHALTDDKTAGL